MAYEAEFKKHAALFGFPVPEKFVNDFPAKRFRKAIKKTLTSRLGRIAGRKLYDKYQELINMSVEVKTKRSAKNIVHNIMVTEKAEKRTREFRTHFHVLTKANVRSKFYPHL